MKNEDIEESPRQETSPLETPLATLILETNSEAKSPEIRSPGKSKKKRKATKKVKVDSPKLQEVFSEISPHKEIDIASDERQNLNSIFSPTPRQQESPPQSLTHLTKNELMFSNPAQLNAVFEEETCYGCNSCCCCMCQISKDGRASYGNCCTLKSRGKEQDCINKFFSRPMNLFCYVSNLVGSFMLIVILLSNIANTNDYNDNTIISIDNNLNAKPIMDIIPTSTTTCPSGYELANFGSWPGTISGCSCSNSLSKGSCSGQTGCTTVESTPSQTLYIWKQTNFCIRRATTFQIDHDCDDGYISCYFGGCYPISNGCPITGIIFTNESSIESTQIGKTTWMIKINKIGGAPIYNLSISQHLPCFTQGLQTNEDSYTLLRHQPNGCDTYGLNPLLSILDSQYEISSLNENGLESQTVSLPGYTEQASSTIINLIALQKYRLTDTACLDSSSLTNFGGISEILLPYQNVLIGYGIAISVIQLLIIYVFGILLIGMLKVPRLYYQSIKLASGCWFLPMIMSLIFLLVLMTFRIQTDTYLNYYSFLVENNCFQEELVNTALQAFVLKYSTLITFRFQVIAAYFCISLITVVYIIVVVKFKKVSEIYNRG